MSCKSLADHSTANQLFNHSVNWSHFIVAAAVALCRQANYWPFFACKGDVELVFLKLLLGCGHNLVEGILQHVIPPHCQSETPHSNIDATEMRQDEMRHGTLLWSGGINWEKTGSEKRDRKRKDILRNGDRGRNLWWDETRRNCHKKKLKVFWGTITMAGSCDMMWHDENRLSKGILLLLITFI